MANKDKPISVGDLVQVVSPPRCPKAPTDDSIGLTFVVEKIVGADSGFCGYCFGINCQGYTGLFATRGKEAWPFYRLKRIPPIEELEGLRSEDEMDIFDFLEV